MKKVLLEELVARARAYEQSLTPQERAAMIAEQARRWALSEMAWGDEGTRVT